MNKTFDPCLSKNRNRTISDISEANISVCRIATVPQLALSSNILNSTASPCISKTSFVSPFKFDIKGKTKGE